MARIAVDALGGDRGSVEVIAGALEASREGIEVVLFGPSTLDAHGLELVPATEEIAMHEKPADAVLGDLMALATQHLTIRLGYARR